MNTPHPHRQRGFALILVLWLSLALASVAITFGQVALFAHRTQSGTTATLQCRQTTRSAITYVKALLESAEAGEMPELEDEDIEKVVVGESAFWLVAPVWGDNGEMDYGLVSEAGKLNLNTATKDMLQLLPGVTVAVAAAIVDWRDENNEPESYGAEDETYSRKSPPYRAKNADFESVEELLLVDGVDEELLYGKDLNQNGVIDPWEDEADSSDDSDFGIWHLLTVCSAEPGGSSSGSSAPGQSADSGKTNVTDTRTLQSYLSQRFSPQVAEAAASHRYTSVLDFAANSGLTREQFAQVESDLVASDEDTVKGLVNVNEAPRAVLACLPGLGTNGADKLVRYRTANSDELTSIAWILDALDDDDVVSQLGPHITTKTYQISADVVAVANHRRAVRRTHLVFDLSSGSPVLISRRDLSGMAWPLEQELWDELRTESLTDDSE